MIELIEKRIVERLKEGLGEIVREVKSYGGELDGNDLFNTIRAMPAIWVTYSGGSSSPSNTARSRFSEENRFVTMIAVQSVRSEESARFGGAYKYEIGTYDLIKAVRYLLTNQTLGGIVYRGLKPTAIRTLFNHYVVQANALSVFALEWSAITHDDNHLVDGEFPEITDDPAHDDYWFNEFRRTALQNPPKMLKTINAEIKDPNSNASIDLEHKTASHPDNAPMSTSTQDSVLDMLKKGKKDGNNQS